MATCQYHDDHGDCPATAARGREFCVRHTLQSAAAASATALETTEGATVLEAREQRASVSEPAEDVEAIGSRMAEMLAQRESAARLQRAQRKVARDKDGLRLPDNPKRVPLKVTPRRVRADSTLMADPVTGANALKPGWVGRWVRERDHENRPTQARVTEFEDFGYEIVRDGSGEPIRTIYGLAMQAPPEQYALRVQQCSPPGALNPGDLIADTEAAIEEVNRRADMEVASLYIDKAHRSERQLVGPGVELLDDVS